MVFNLFKLFSLMTFSFFLSRISGLIRDIVTAHYFGASSDADSFFIAFKFPNFLRRIFAEGAFSQVFIPLLIEYKNKSGVYKTKYFISYVFGYLILILFLIVLFGIFFVSYVFFPILSFFMKISDKLVLSINLFKIVFPYVLFVSLASFVGSILNVWNIFFVPSLSQIILNINVICFVFLFSSYFNPSIKALAFGILFGGILQFLYQLPFLKKINMLTVPKISFNSIEVSVFIKNMKPLIISALISQISLILNTYLSSCLKSGSVSWTYYADRLIEFPTGIISVSLLTIIIPILAKNILNNNYIYCRNLIDSVLRLCLLFTLPCSIGLIILSKPLISILFKYGNFEIYDVEMTSQILFVYCIGFFGFICSKIFVSCFYSMKDFVTPVKVSVFTLIVVQIINFVFFRFTKHLTLALSVSIGSYFNSFVLYLKLRKEIKFVFTDGWKYFLFQLFCSLIFMSIILILLNNLFLISCEKYFLKILLLFLIIIFSIISYFVGLLIFGLRFRKVFKIFLRNRM